MRKFSIALGLSVCVGIFSASPATAATFTNIYNFSADGFEAGPNPQATNGDGVSPDSVIVSGNTIFGTCLGGGLYGYGTVFRVNTDGTHFTNLANFNIGTYDAVSSTYSESTGDYPNAGLLLVSNTLYGTTFYGGKFDAGTVFKVNTDSSGFTVLASLDFTNGQGPSSGLLLYNNALYGTAAGGTNASGTIFVVSLADSSLGRVCLFTNLEEPYGGVVMVSNAFYGFGRYGGASSNGVVYRAAGGGYTVLYNFDGVTGSSSYATPVLSGNTLFGTSYQGGTNQGGNIFRIDLDGSHYTNLFNFEAQSGGNTTGSNPYDFAGLVLSGNTLYGSTSVSGGGGQGTVFQINTDGTGFKVLHSFQYSDGSQPDPLTLIGGTLYGTATYGIQGISLGDGGVFALTLQPTLNIALSGNQAVLTWDDPSYSLYSGSTVTNITTPVVGAFTGYTTPASSAQQYFRLESN